ncbi:hypothetical protein ME7_01559, partial [Bartonella birtlesii LL-WM9]
MKKRQLSPSVARMVEEFQKKHEQSTATPPARNTQKPPLPKRPENITHARVTPPKTSHISNTTTQESQAAQISVTPQRPPRARERQQSNTTTKENQTAQVRVAPQRPPRARDRELLNKATTQEGEGVYAIPAPQKPPRMRGNSVKQKQPEASLYDKPALQRQQPTQA